MSRIEPAMSKTELVMDYIARHPGCRTRDIASALRVVDAKSVSGLMQGYVDKGLLVVARIEDGSAGKPMCEYRVSATVPDDWRKDPRLVSIRKRGEDRLTVVPASAPPGAQPAVARSNTGSLPSGTEVPPPEGPAVEPPAATAKPVAAGEHVDDAHGDDGQVSFALWSTGAFSINDGTDLLVLSKADTLRLYLYILGTVGFFDEPDAP